MIPTESLGESPTYKAYSRSRSLLKSLMDLDISRSRSRSYSPYSRRHERGGHSDNGHRSKSRAPKIEYIIEFGGVADKNDENLAGVSPPSSPLTQADVLNWSEHSTFNSCKE